MAVKQAYFTLVQNEAWVVGAVVLGHSLRKSKAKATLVCQAGAELSVESIQRLTQVYDIVENAGEYRFPQGGPNKYEDIPQSLAFSFRRLNAWCRTEFERITYLDSDIVVIQNIDSLFRVPGVAAPREFAFRVWMRGKNYTDFFNGGMVTFTPTLSTFERFQDVLASRWVYLGAAEQHLVNLVCRHNWFRTPDSFHVQAGTIHHAHFARNPGRIRALHFSKISKPWDSHYSGRDKLWESWRTFSRLWLEYLRDYEAEYSDCIAPSNYWWEEGSMSTRHRTRDDVTVERKKIGGRRRARRIVQAPRKLAEIAVFKGAFQKISELAQLIALLRRRKLRTVVEIGTFRGGTHWVWCMLAAANAQIISIDLPVTKSSERKRQAKLRNNAIESQRLKFLRSDSTKYATQLELVRMLDGDPIDFLFIDGDHRYESVKRDFELYSPLVRPGGIVALHDILHHPSFPNSQVDRYWQEIKTEHRFKELVDPMDERGWGQWGGIGVIYVR